MSDPEDGREAQRAEPAEPPLILGKLLDHLEKTLADSYRKEIEQEENVWRSLPFFAATLALQLAAIVGLAEKLPPPDSENSWWIAVPLGVAALATLAALLFMAVAIAPSRFRYIAPEPDLRVYAQQLSEAERAHPETAAAAGEEAGSESAAEAWDEAPADAAESPTVPGRGPDALSVFKNEIARQFGLATHHNRLINQRRAQQRSIAGLCMLTAVLATLVLVGVTVHHHLRVVGNHGRPAGVPGAPSATTGEQDHGSAARPQQPERQVPADRPEGQSGGSSDHRRIREAPAGPGDPPGDARGPEGLVDEHRAPGHGGRLREGGP